jgi:hypothetical protein
VGVAGQVELGEGTRDAFGDGADRERQLLPDRSIGAACGHEFEYVAFALAYPTTL